jgi:bifunctional non-homologous end joining protein LigD
MASPTKRKAVTVLPAFIPPQLATLIDRAPAGGESVHDIKFDGYGMAVRLEDRRARMLTRNALDWTARFGPIATAAARLKARPRPVAAEAAQRNQTDVTIQNQHECWR